MKQIKLTVRTGSVLLISGLVGVLTLWTAEPARAVGVPGNWVSSAGTAQEPVPNSLTSEESAMLQMINQERMNAGLAKLDPDPQLIKLARAKSRDMVGANYFGHLSKKLGTVYDQLQQNGIPYRVVAENLVGAGGYRRAHQSIMQSPAHRSNVLNPSFTRIGLGIVKGGPYGKMVTQILID